MKNYYSIGETSKLIQVAVPTLRNWEKNGKLKPHHYSAGGHRYYSKEQIEEYLGTSQKPKQERLHVSYARVSTSKQKTSLKNQTERLLAFQASKGRSTKLITDIGSGLNYTKPGLTELIELVLEGKIETITVTYRDRLLRFGIPLLEQICKKYETTIEYLEVKDQDDKEQIAQDVLEVLTVYTAKLNGKKAARARELMKELSNE